MKKIYQKPKADWVAFQIDEAIMSGSFGNSDGGGVTGDGDFIEATGTATFQMNKD